MAHLRLALSPDWSIGPGKARLLEAIEATGSIAAAGRRLKMSYKRAWNLVEELNAGFREPLVTSTRGGSTGGGAGLTPAGRSVLDGYRRIEAQAEAAVAAEVAALRALLAPKNGGPAGQSVADEGESDGEGRGSDEV
ncbi:LysR family transcriptional regulator [Jiella sp. MQZ13P-4]|uniref:LysR family transcriptional regulator n=1 Tax=Jiella sonneratiae TaxID=2816856 RepID=A0ABS3J065_9HYPH|nr:LysR family transcriptional regulator [Jiella sonneratiae]